MHSRLTATYNEALDAEAYRLIEHLKKEQQDLAVALGIVQNFSENLFDFLVQDLNLQVSSFEFESVTSWLIIEPISIEEDTDIPIYRCQDVISQAIRSSEQLMSKRLKVLLSATKYLHNAVDDEVIENPYSLLKILKGIQTGWASSDKVSEEALELLLDVYYAFYDSGYWNELTAISPKEISSGNLIYVLNSFFEALATRRNLGVVQAKNLLNSLQDKVPSGKFESFFELELGYINGLAGDYTSARRQFLKLCTTLVPFNPERRDHVRSRLYYGDMLIMDGDFLAAISVLEEAAVHSADVNTLDWVEFTRHIAHSYRFSFDYREAVFHYSKALHAVSNAPSMAAKLHTNLAESYALYDPHLALQYVEKACSLNSALGNQIELGKCYAAKAAALGKVGQFDSAKVAACKSIANAKSSGYVAGEAFALQNLCYINVGMGEIAEAERIFDELSGVVAGIETYDHLLIGPTVALDKNINSARTSFQWVDRNDLISKIKLAVAMPG